MAPLNRSCKIGEFGESDRRTTNLIERGGLQTSAAPSGRGAPDWQRSPSAIQRSTSGYYLFVSRRIVFGAVATVLRYKTTPPSGPIRSIESAFPNRRNLRHGDIAPAERTQIAFSVLSIFRADHVVGLSALSPIVANGRPAYPLKGTAIAIRSAPIAWQH